MSNLVSRPFDPLAYVSPSRISAINAKMKLNKLAYRLTTVDLESLPVNNNTGARPMRDIVPENPVFIMGKLTPNDKREFNTVNEAQLQDHSRAGNR